MFWSSHKHYNLQYVIYFSFEDLLALPHLLVLAKSFPFFSAPGTLPWLHKREILLNEIPHIFDISIVVI